MSATRVGIRKLKSHLSHYLKLVKAGEVLIITDRGKPIGRIVPMGLPAEKRIANMVQAGMAEWNGGKPAPYRPRVVNRGPRQVADLVEEGREWSSMLIPAPW